MYDVFLMFEEEQITSPQPTLFCSDALIHYKLCTLLLSTHRACLSTRVSLSCKHLCTIKKYQHAKTLSYTQVTYTQPTLQTHSAQENV